MNLKEVAPSALSDRTERATAKLARKARANVYFGGASALVLAKRMGRCKVPAMDVVSAAYRNNQGEAREFLAYECPECGSAVLGETNAINHCNNEEKTDNS